MPHDLRAAEHDFEVALDRVVWRLRLRSLAGSLAGALAAAAVAGLILRLATAAPPRTLIVAVNVAAFIAGALVARVLLHPRRARARAAVRLERADTTLQNLVITAEQLLDDSERTRAYMRQRVFMQAARRLATIPASRAVPLLPVALIFVAALSFDVWAMSVTVQPRRGRPSVPAGPAAASSAPRTLAPGDMAVELTPPAYSGLKPVTLLNPTAIETLSGTRAVIRIRASSVPTLRVNAASLHPSDTGGTFVTETVLKESGFVSVEAPGLRKVVPLTVNPDRVPDVRILAPAKDLRMPNAASTIPIEAAAADDLGLGRFEIRYTRISGTGEQFQFTEGTLNASVAKASDISWHASTALDLGALHLEPGDSLVYRAVAEDRRPGGEGEASSETYFVEIAGPGEIALPGFDMPPDKERYALSQQMIVLKIQRLMARESSLTGAAVEEAAGNIAAEQRAVRANFIFLLGGTVEDEEEEAHGESEIAEGRFENNARREVLGATRLMQEVEQALSVPSTKTALPPAQAAARALQQAFGHNRYLLRALPDRSRVDPSRRLSGDLTGAEDWARALTADAPDQSVLAARRALRDLVTAAASLDSPSATVTGESLTRLAERVLAIAPGAHDLARSAADLQTARDRLAAGHRDQAHASLIRAADPIRAVAQRDLTAARPRPSRIDRLAGAREPGR